MRGNCVQICQNFFLSKKGEKIHIISQINKLQYPLVYMCLKISNSNKTEVINCSSKELVVLHKSNFVSGQTGKNLHSDSLNLCTASQSDRKLRFQSALAIFGCIRRLVNRVGILSVCSKCLNSQYMKTHRK